MGTVSVVTDATFDSEVLKSNTPVVVDFFADWCGPCKALAPVLEDVARELGGKVKIVKMNVDDSPDAPGKYGIRSIPTLILFKGGEVVTQSVGGMPKAQLQQWVEKAI